jgi:uncharacterized membrane protein
MNKLFDIFTYAFLVGGLLVLTRPGSQGPKFISSLTGGYAHIVQAATGQKVQG